MRRTIRAFVALSAGLQCACHAAGPAARPSWCTSGAATARLVTAPAEPAALSLVEVWRRGGLRDGETLGYPSPPVVSTSGWIAIADWQLGTVMVLDSAGGWIGPVTHQGEGPGETRLPVTASWTRTGALSILDGADLSILRLQPPDFRFLDQAPAPRTLLQKSFAAGEILAVFLDPDGRVGVQPPRERLDATGRARDVFAIESADGSVDTLLSDTTRIFDAPPLGGLVVPGHPTPLAAVGAGGGLAVAGDVPHYRVRLLGATLRDSLVICRDVPAAPLTAGELWVQRDRSDPLTPQAPPPGATYDVYGAGGTYRGTLTAPPHAVLYGEIGKLVIGLETGAYDETSVVAYRLVSGR